MSDLISRQGVCAWLDNMGCPKLAEAILDEKRFPPAKKWTPCSKRLPNEEERKRAYIRNQWASEFIVMIAGGNKPTTLYLTYDGWWVDDERNHYEVIAWQQLPEPYEGGDEE